jgi:VWFA-related protein
MVLLAVRRLYTHRAVAERSRGVQRRTACTLAALAAFTLPAVIPAAGNRSVHSDGQDTTPQSQTTFRSTANLVQLDVVVTDSKGRPVADLGRDDFFVKERGAPQHLEAVRYVSTPVGPAPARTASADAAGIDVADNAPNPSSRQWVLLIDDLQIIEEYARETREAARGFLQALPADDQVALVFVGRSDLSQDFSLDRAAQLKGIEGTSSALGFASDAADDLDERSRYFNARSSLESLTNVLRSLEGSRHIRRVLVYVSSGMTYSMDRMFFTNRLDPPYEQLRTREILERMSEVLANASRIGIPIYTLDPRGIPDCRAVRRDCASPPRTNIRAQQQMLRTIADSTGGRALVNQPDISAAARQIVQDNSGFYVVSYYPSPFEEDGRFHEVSVSVRRKGLTVRARAGYTAPKPQLGSEVASLSAILSRGVSMGGLVMRATAIPLAVEEGRVSTLVTFTVDHPDILPAPVRQDRIQLGIVALDVEGNLRGELKKVYRLSTERSGVLKASFHELIVLPPGSLTVRVGVISEATGRAGSVHLPVVIPNRESHKLSVPGAIFGSSAHRNEGPGIPDSVSRLVPFAPTVAREFRTADRVQLLVPVWGAETGNPVSLTVELVSQAQPETLKRRFAASPAQDLGTSRFISLLDLTGLPPGGYVCRLIATSSGRSSQRDIAIRIVP